MVHDNTWESYALRSIGANDWGYWRADYTVSCVRLDIICRGSSCVGSRFFLVVNVH